MKKKALITGITGQDGSYLAEFLLKKGYVVHGVKENRRHLIQLELIIFIKISMKLQIFLHYGDLGDSNSLVNIISKIRPNEIYNLGAQSHVGHSFEIPEYTSEVSGLGTLRVLEAMRFLKLNKTKFYQASTSELFGERRDNINSFNEKSPMVPKSPYGVSKLYSYFMTKVYREAYGFLLVMEFYLTMKVKKEDICNRKITMYFAKNVGFQGNIVSWKFKRKRDWGHKDYTAMQWKIYNNQLLMIM